MEKDEKAGIERHDQLVHWRCPRLGGEVTFRYCRKVAGGKPCDRILACWENTFDVAAFLERYYDLDELAATWSEPKPDKVVQLAELVKRATKKGNESNRSSGSQPAK